MKKIFLSLSFLFLCLSIFAVDLVNEPSVQAFRDAKSLFLNKEYGKALNKCEDAITFRKENVEDEMYKKLDIESLKIFKKLNLNYYPIDTIFLEIADELGLI